MKEADHLANIFFHAAMAVGSGRSSGVVGAIFEACRYLNPEAMYSDRGSAIKLYATLYGHIGDVWPRYGSARGGQWITQTAKMELLTSLLFVYEYLVQDMGAARSSAELGNS